MFTRRPLRVREYDGASGLRTLNGNVRLAPYAGAFNHTGQPAVSVPVAPRPTASRSASSSSARPTPSRC